MEGVDICKAKASNAGNDGVSFSTVLFKLWVAWWVTAPDVRWVWKAGRGRLGSCRPDSRWIWMQIQF